MATTSTAAFRDTRSFGATIPMKSPSRTIDTPGTAAALVVSIASSVAPGDSGRIMRPMSIPGLTTSDAYW